MWRVAVILVVFHCVRAKQKGFDSSLFWSYYNKPSVDRATLAGGGYERDTPDLWQGKYQNNGSPKGRNNIDNFLGIPKSDEILVVGALSKISHGPRKKREIARNRYFNNAPSEFEIQQAKDFISMWPTKTTVEKTKTVSYDPYSHYDDHYRRFREQAANPLRTFAQPYCRHVCHIGDPDIPCCSSLSSVHSIGPFVQPSLVENWMTGIFEFAASNQVLVVAVKSAIHVGLLGLVMLFWGYMGEGMGVVELPRARFIKPVIELNEQEQILLDVVDGNWLLTLENHIVGNKELNDTTNFICCVFKPDDKVNDVLECFPSKSYKRHSPPKFKCNSGLRYDISLNLKALKPTDQKL